MKMTNKESNDKGKSDGEDDGGNNDSTPDDGEVEVKDDDKYQP